MPLELANVKVLNTSAGAICDSNGHFLINNLCAGKYVLEVSHIGCEPIFYNVNLKTSVRGLKIYLEHHNRVAQGSQHIRS